VSGDFPSEWELQLKGQIRRRYARLAKDNSFPSGAAERAIEAGYPAAWIEKMPKELAASYSGCGFFFGGVSFTGTETVVDLGCGAGFDSHLASYLGAGTVIAIDMTPEMLDRVRTFTATKTIAGDMERLPLANNIADTVIANASFNLTVDKIKAFAEARRILRPGGRLIARDLVRVGDLPAEILSDPLSYNTSLGGAIEEAALIETIQGVGFKEVRISDHKPFSVVVSIKIEAVL